ncbi:hypothetical protein GOBAR_AA25483 [Gossypium barbadense]|uniref:Uncharacterized protein n=1 Tax=Gossypium barbadense TaxID=3634 RepID=A0A2P5WVR3_GOSBA|nr:hypothetical protein GOBAR_AA25483 [Gossypium barbadense]
MAATDKIRNECCERLAYYGINTNLVNYLKFQLNQRNVMAVSNVTNWSGKCYVMPLIGAFFADAYLGRYWTIASFSIIYVFGMIILTISASIHGLKPKCDENNICHSTGRCHGYCSCELLSGTKLYRNQRPGGSPLTRIFQVMVASVGKARVEVPNDKSLLQFEEAENSIIRSN